MTLTFQYTVDDINEVRVAQARFLATGSVTEPKANAANHFGKGLVGWVVLVVVGALMWYLLITSKSAAPTPSSHPPAHPIPTHNFLQVVLPLWLPMFVIVAFIGFFIFRQLGERRVAFPLTEFNQGIFGYNAASKAHIMENRTEVCSNDINCSIT